MSGIGMDLDEAVRYARAEREGPHAGQVALGLLLAEVERLRAVEAATSPTGDDDRGRLDSLRAWAISEPPASLLLADVRWAIREIERHRLDLCVTRAGGA